MLYLLLKPWYESYNSQVRLSNLTIYNINIVLSIQSERSRRKQINRLVDGYIEVTSPLKFSIPDSYYTFLHVKGQMGFCDEFKRTINLEINNCNNMTINYRGQGIMPIIQGDHRLSRLELTQKDVMEQYKLLQRVYYFDIFKNFTEEEEFEPPIMREEGEYEDFVGPLPITDVASEYQCPSGSISMLSVRSSGSALSHRTMERKFYCLMKSYIVVNSNQDVPNAMILEQLLETERFLDHLAINRKTRHLLQLVYNEHKKFTKNYDKSQPFYLKYFTIQPLPFEMRGYVYNMGSCKMHEFYYFNIKLHFFGPGKLIAAVRTETKIPGLIVKLDVETR